MALVVTRDCGTYTAVNVYFVNVFKRPVEAHLGLLRAVLAS
jgi:hypothetical protein